MGNTDRQATRASPSAVDPPSDPPDTDRETPPDGLARTDPFRDQADTDPAPPVLPVESPHDTPVEGAPAADAGAADEAAAEPPPSAGRPAPQPIGESVDAVLGTLRTARGTFEPPATISQSDGLAAAVYHGEHAVLAAEPSPHEEAEKVVVTRGSASRRLATQTERTTESEPRVMAGRVIVAIIAALTVVAVFFVALNRTRKAPSAPVAGAPFSAAAPPALASAPPPAVGTTVASAQAAPTTAPSAARASRDTSASGTSSTASSKQPGGKTNPSPSNLGEFKTTFH
jgi:hypothetical protein